MADRWRALRVQVMVCYVLRPRPSQQRYSALRVGSVSAARQMELIPRPPSAFAGKGSHCVARSPCRQPRHPSAPAGGSPKPSDHNLFSAFT